jgi:hypothetical protein
MSNRYRLILLFFVIQTAYDPFSITYQDFVSFLPLPISRERFMTSSKSRPFLVMLPMTALPSSNDPAKYIMFCGAGELYSTFISRAIAMHCRCRLLLCTNTLFAFCHDTRHRTLNLYVTNSKLVSIASHWKQFRPS